MHTYPLKLCPVRHLNNMSLLKPITSVKHNRLWTPSFFIVTQWVKGGYVMIDERLQLLRWMSIVRFNSGILPCVSKIRHDIVFLFSVWSRYIFRSSIACSIISSRLLLALGWTTVWGPEKLWSEARRVCLLHSCSGLFGLSRRECKARIIDQIDKAELIKSYNRHLLPDPASVRFHQNCIHCIQVLYDVQKKALSYPINVGLYTANHSTRS